MKKRKILVAVVLLIITGSAMAFSVGFTGAPIEPVSVVETKMEATPHFGFDNFIWLAVGVLGLGLARRNIPV